MPMFAERARETQGERHVPEATAFRCRHVTLPLRSLDADLPFPEVQVWPLQRHHLTACANVAERSIGPPEIG
jgi:hypothetical protein